MVTKLRMTLAVLVTALVVSAPASAQWTFSKDGDHKASKAQTSEDRCHVTFRVEAGSSAQAKAPCFPKDAVVAVWVEGYPLVFANLSRDQLTSWHYGRATVNRVVEKPDGWHVYTSSVAGRPLRVTLKVRSY